MRPDWPAGLVCGALEALPEFSNSAVYMRGLVRAIDKLGMTGSVRAACRDGATSLLTNPSAQAWWPATDVCAFCEAMGAAGGNDFVTEVGRLAIKDSIAAVIQPLVGVFGAVGLLTPPSVFSRIGQFSMTSIRGVGFTWAQLGPSTGRLVLDYFRQVPDCLPLLWLGPIEYGYQLARATGAPTQVSVAGSKWTFELAWK